MSFSTLTFAPIQQLVLLALASHDWAPSTARPDAAEKSFETVVGAKEASVVVFTRAGCSNQAAPLVN